MDLGVDPRIIGWEYTRVAVPFCHWIRVPGWVKNQDPDPG
jgi:hypothetical protein